MRQPPVIIVQLVHIQGPLKGNIQEFAGEKISIGRHPSNLLQFPIDVTMVSRHHAEIIREGNRFKLLDLSTNGTFVNGKRVKETYLKSGDVLTFAEGGPKVSFLTQIKEGQRPAESDLPHQPSPPPAKPPYSPAKPPYSPERLPYSSKRPEGPPRPSSVREEPALPAGQPSARPQPESSVGQDVAVQKVKVPLVIQYGPTLRSFKEVPVTMGRGPDCDFRLDHQGIFDRQAQIFFSQDQYWAKDLTGRGLILINRQPVHLQSPLHPDDELALSSEGPVFRFLGGGRLLEIQEPSPESFEEDQARSQEYIKEDAPEKKEMGGALSILKKFLKR
ncbi:MAG: FHA domain-containing protein [bacterium]